MSSMPMNQLEDAIYTWVRVGSGLAAANVNWAAQNQASPVGTHITLRMRSIRPLGNDWVDVEDNPSPSAGAEVLFKVRGMRRVTLTIACYGEDPIGADGPLAIVNDVLTALALPSRSDALASAGVGISQIADVQALDGVEGSTTFEPRAQVDVVFFAAAELVETGTYIEHVGGVENSVLTPSETFDI